MTPNSATDEKEAGKPAASSQFWQLQLAAAKKDHRDFWEYAAKTEKRYRNQKSNVEKAARGRRLSILYSNTETMRSALYARTAKPDVRQRFTQQADVLARTAGELLERCLSYCADTTSHDRAFRQGVLDLVLPGRGVVWLEYEPKIETDEMGNEVIADQKVNDTFVYYQDFLHSPARCWAEVWWIGRRHRMTREDLKQAGFDKAETIPLNWAPDIDGGKGQECPEDLKRAEVWEIWHKPKRERVWVVEGYPDVLRKDEDPYGLQEFWPCAEPAQAITLNDTFVPHALYSEYEDQAEDLDEITERISKLTRALKRRGVYDASVKELKRLARANDNEFIPAENWGAFSAGGGLKGAFQVEDLKPIADTLLALYQTRDQLIQAIYEITGISDVMRGSTDANETLGAQQLKAQFGSSRIKIMQQDVQRWIRDTLRIKAELIAEHFEPPVLLAMSGMDLQTEAERQMEEAQEMQAKAMEWQQAAQQAMAQGQPPPPQPQPEPEDPNEDPTIDAVVQLLRDDRLRSYQIDIETDSTIFEDAEQEKTSRTELLTAISTFMTNWIPVAQVGGQPMAKLGFEMLEFGVRGFKSGRQLEDAIEEAKEAIEEAANQPPQPPPPDPAVEREKMKMEGDKQRLQADMQLKGMDMELKKMDLQTKGMEVEVKKASLALDQEAKAVELNFKRQQMEMDLTGKRIAQEYDSEARRTAAEEKRMEMAERAKAKPEPQKKEKKPRKVQFERDADGRIVGAVVN